ncbi:acyl-CoA synthetase [Pradoshia eiseniae]|uniref:Acyl-CoA synthetase n=1 Tax=Pradoshia eiseniae TaxID=2064768 RepID=A0A2S7N4Y6_9BACI|nr:long-chain fatty acid--CoA ligase [Pradoshia eiseniae]PQD97099.1 acyl-CoA synthetase [Pradoshia eiseniae]
MTTSSLHLSRSLLIGEHLRRSAHKAPDKEAYIFGEKRLTYRQTEERAIHLAGWLQGRGVDYDDKVGFLLFNGIPFIEIFYGVSLTGALGVPINFRLNSDELQYIIANSDCKILFIDRKLLPSFELIKDRCPLVQEIVVIGGETELGYLSYERIYGEETEYVPIDRLNGDDGALIMYTSGTTGLPKGAVLTHNNLYINGMNQVMTAGLNPDFKQLIVAPLFHIAAISTLLYPIQGTTVIHQQFDSEQVLKTIEKERINFIFLAPTMWQMLVDHENIGNYDLTSMKRCSAGSAPCSIALKEKIARYFPNGELRDPFGQTEMSPVATCLNPEDSIRKNTSVGKPVVNVEVRVVDEQMNDVPLGEIGEIVYRGPTLMKEYYKNPEATEEAFRGGWFHSGDLVRMDDEGFIYVVDRKKDMIISGGENIYPAEIEQVLIKHPDIKECAVIGAADEKWGESVKAVIVKREGAELNEEDIIRFCQNQLSSYKKPRQVQFLDALPRNAAGKILKKALRQAEEGVTGG